MPETAINLENILGTGDSQNGGLTGMLGGAGNTGMLALVTMLMQILNNQQQKSGVSPSNAIGATENMRNYYSNQANAASVPQSQVDTMRQAVTQRGTAPPVSPTVTASTSVPGMTAAPKAPAQIQLTDLMKSMPNKMAAPAVPGTTPAPSPTVQAPAQKPTAYNPYGGQGTMAGVDPSLIMQMMNLLQPNQNTQWANGALQGQLSNRFGTRGMRQGTMPGGFTPYQMPGQKVIKPGLPPELQ